MIEKGGLPLLLMLTPWMLGGCDKLLERMSLAGDPVVAEVGSIEIRRSYFLNSFAELPEQDKQLYLTQPNGKEDYLDRLLGREEWLDLARKAHVDRSPEFRKEYATRKDILMASLYRKNNTGDLLRASDAEIEAYYREHREEFGPKVEIRASRIVTTTLEDARRAREAAQEEDFIAVARRLSIEPFDQRGRQLPPIIIGNTPSDLEKTLRTMPIGRVTPPMPFAGGYQLLKKEGQIDWPSEPLDWVRSDIRRKLLQRKETACIAQLLTTAKVTIHKKNLDPVVLPGAGPTTPH